MALDRERVTALYDKAPVALATVVVTGVLITWLLRDRVQPAWLVAWLVVLALVTLMRALGIVLFRRREKDAMAFSAWERLFALGALLNGLAWGAAGYGFTDTSLPHTVILVFVIGGLTAGASSSNSTSITSFAAFSVPALLPTIVALVLMGRDIQIVMGVTLLLFGGAMAALARQSGASLAEATELRIRNAALVRVLEARSAERSARLRHLLDQAGIVALVADPDTQRTVEFGDNAAAFFDRSLEELEGTSLPDLRTLPQLSSALAWRELIEEARQSSGKVVSGPASNHDGTPYHLELQVTVRAVDGRDFVLVVLRDVSERKALEAQLTRAEMLASLGRLAAGVAHEVNNPLTYILGNLSELRSRACFADDVEALALLDEVVLGAEQIRRIAKDLTATARKQEVEITSVDVGKVLEFCLSVTSAEIRHCARLVQKIEPVPPIRGDEVRLRQVFLNLLINAVHAMSGEDAEQNRLTVSTRVLEGQVSVSVRDTGMGIPAGNLDTVFQPFVTTKGPGQGTGLGLSICYAIVSEFGGRIAVESELGEGSCFTVTLPFGPRADSTPAPPPARQSETGRRVLLVDDDERVARSTARILGHHEVIALSCAQEALALLANDDAFDVIVCDVMMPGMSGVEFHKRLAKHAPSIAERVIFVTGGAFSTKAEDYLAEVPNSCLSKPFDATELRALVASIGQPASNEQ